MVTDNDPGTRATTWIRRIARGIGSFVAAYWLFIGIISAVSGQEPWTLESTMIAGFICGAAFSAFAYFTAGHNQAIAMLVSGAPFIVAGVLLLVSWWTSRRSGTHQNLA